jgi:phosphoserine phosphatase
MRPVAFDFDGTLSDSEMVVSLGEAAGVADRVAEVTRRAMDGELAYAESLRERVGLLDGLPLADAEDAFAGVRLRPGAGSLLADLHSANREDGPGGVRTAVFTGGFERGVTAALSRAGGTVDRVVANRLVDDGECLTGAVEGPLVEGTKDDALRAWCEELGATPADAVAVGDGANDLPMLEVAGLAVGYDPKPAVAPACDVVVDSVPELRAALVDAGVLRAD